MDFRWFWRSKLGGRPLEYEINYKIDELSIYLVLMNVIILVMPYIRAIEPQKGMKRGTKQERRRKRSGEKHSRRHRR